MSTTFLVQAGAVSLLEVSALVSEEVPALVPEVVSALVSAVSVSVSVAALELSLVEASSLGSPDPGVQAAARSTRALAHNGAGSGKLSVDIGEVHTTPGRVSPGGHPAPSPGCHSALTSGALASLREGSDLGVWRSMSARSRHAAAGSGGPP